MCVVDSCNRLRGAVNWHQESSIIVFVIRYAPRFGELDRLTELLNARLPSTYNRLNFSPIELSSAAISVVRVEARLKVNIDLYLIVSR